MRELFMSDVAELYGASMNTVLSWRRRGQLPPADGEVSQQGHVRPWWHESTLAGWSPPGKVDAA